MKIGRAITSTGEVAVFAAVADDDFRRYDPGTRLTGEQLSVTRLLPPVLPGKIVAVGLNYRDHANEMGLEIPEVPILFLKPSTSVIGPQEDIIYPGQSSRVDYEAELGVVIGRTCRDVDARDAKDYILGYTCVNDVTARDLQARDGQWTRAKSFDTFAPIGPWIATGIEDPHTLSIHARLNGETKQSSNTSNLIFTVYELVDFISHVMTLREGDVIATGTPSGVGPMSVGDEIAIEIERIGVLTNRVTR